MRSLAWLLWAAPLLAGAQVGPLPPAQVPQALALQAGQKVQLDGRLDDAAWARAPVMDRFFLFSPRDRELAAPAYRTTVQVLVEDDALVVGVRAFDAAPGEIRSSLVRRDEVRRDQDFIVVYLDAAGERRSAQWLRINAEGVLTDGMHIADGDREDFAPDFAFEGAAQRLGDGYSVELRLPLIALRTPHAGAAADSPVWRFMVGRRIPRTENLLLLSVPLTHETLNFIAELAPLDGVQGLARRAQTAALLKLRPELTLRHTRVAEGGPRQTKWSAGLDVKWRPRADWVIDATLNPDFAQVELDAPQLAGNTRFALSLPEKRPFFLESTDILDLPANAFYSRSVTDPRYGLRATWRGQSADATALSLQDEGGGLILRPGPFGTDAVRQDLRSQATLLRGRWHGNVPALGALSAGALLTQRDYAGAGHNRVFGLDASWQPDATQQWWLRGLHSQTSTGFDANGALQRQTAVNGQRVYLQWQRKTQDWILKANAGHISPGFRNDNGFVERSGVAWAEAEVIRRLGAQPMWLFGFPTNDLEWFVWGRHMQTLADPTQGIVGGQILEQRIHPGVWWAASQASEGFVLLALDQERVRNGGPLHRTRSVGFEYSWTPGAHLTHLGFEGNVGEKVDVQADRVAPGVTLDAQAKWRGQVLGLGWEAEHSLGLLRLARPSALGGGSALSERTVRSLFVMHFNARDALRVVWQGGRYARAAEPGIATEAGSRRTLSLVYQHRIAPGRGYGLGASRSGESGRPSEVELFAKISFEL
jgi:hypothetical protein